MMEEIYTRDLLHTLQTQLVRIVTALEESNRITKEWIATQSRWHEETQAVEAQRTDFERRIVAVHEQGEARQRKIEEEITRLREAAQPEEDEE